ncbi:hypothetical protein IWQ56_001888 [Coemansia nantahalensis]|nr:hypothetical protein IWQ56_001888 [Coemansia nantahalensis]
MTDFPDMDTAYEMRFTTREYEQTAKTEHLQAHYATDFPDMDTAYEMLATLDEDNDISPLFAGLASSDDTSHASIVGTDTVPAVADPALEPRVRDGIEYVGEAHRELLILYEHNTVTLDFGYRDKICAVNTRGDEMRFTAREYEQTAKTEHHQAIREREKRKYRAIRKAEAELPSLADYIHDPDALADALREWDQRIIPLYRPLNLNQAADGGDGAAGGGDGDVAAGGGDVAAGGGATDRGAARPAVVGIPPARLAEVLDADCDAHGSPLFIKLRLDGFINRQRADAYMCAKIFKVLGDGTDIKPLLVPGDWSGTNMRYHSPIASGMAMCRAFRNYGFPVLLMDEFRTSMIHSECGSIMIYPKIVSRARLPLPVDSAGNQPREWDARCHGLPACPNPKCFESVLVYAERNRLEREQRGDPLPNPPKSNLAKVQHNGYNKQRATEWARNKFGRLYKYRNYKLTNRVRTRNEFRFPKDRIYCLVHRDFDACRSMHIIVASYRDGFDRPLVYCRSVELKKRKGKKAKGKKAKGKLIAKAPDMDVWRYVCLKCRNLDHGHGKCPPKNSSAETDQAESSKRPTDDNSATDVQAESSKRPLDDNSAETDQAESSKHRRLI